MELYFTAQAMPDPCLMITEQVGDDDDAVCGMSGSMGGAQDAAMRLKRGAGLLAAGMDREDTYYRQAAQLQRSWKLKRSPSGAAAPLAVDISLPFAPKGRREPSVEPLLLNWLASGDVHIPALHPHAVTIPCRI